MNNIHGVVAGPVATHGVVAFVTCQTETCRMFLYKHSPGQGTPWDGGAAGSSGAAGSAGAAGSGAGGLSGSGGASGSSSGGSSTSSGGSRGGGAQHPAAATSDDGGCGCRALNAGRAGGTGWALGIVLSLLALRRSSASRFRAQRATASRFKSS
jgi:hypothetical protein